MFTAWAFTQVCRMKKFPTKVSRQVHWCAEPDDSEDEELTVSTVQVRTYQNRAHTSQEIRHTRDGDNGKSMSIDDRLKARHKIEIEPAIMLPLIYLIIDEATWLKVGKPELKETKLEAMAYNNSPISFDGKCKMKVEFEGRSEEMVVYVLHTANHPLCGRDMIRRLQINCGPYVKSIDPKLCYTKEQLREKIKSILLANQVLFQKGLGKCTTARVSLKLKEGFEKPKFCRVRPVPIALRPKVEAKLQELVENGTLTRVEHSEWATPLVVVPKPGGKIRLCRYQSVPLTEAG
ncbi:hypothetical protein COOONC_24293 [Cooperia oncophora]